MADAIAEQMAVCELAYARRPVVLTRLRRDGTEATRTFYVRPSPRDPSLVDPEELDLFVRAWKEIDP